MPPTSNEERLAEILSQCMAELIAELGIAAKHIPGVQPHLATHGSTTAFSGFGSGDLRGSFTLTGPSAVFSRLHPLPPTVTLRDLADWACELVNQATGRFRNRLLAYGVRLALGVPQSVLSDEVRLSSSLRPGRSPISFAVDDMILEGWLELEIKPGFQLPENPSAENAEALKEGSLVFF